MMGGLESEENDENAKVHIKEKDGFHSSAAPCDESIGNATVNSNKGTSFMVCERLAERIARNGL